MARQTRRYNISPYQPSLFTDDELDAPTLRALDPEKVKPAVGTVKFMSFGSGSSGNCAFLTDGYTGLLIDAGVDPEHVERSLTHHGFSMDMVRGVLLTHDHSDHVRFVYKLVRGYKHIRVYCTPKAFNGIMRRHSISRRLKDYFEAVYKEHPFKIGAWDITLFDVSHDGTDNAGFFITNGPHTICIATDLGTVTDRVRFYMQHARNIVLESNYDLEMLRRGPYPEFLKSRIAADRGHLDNVDSARFVTELMAAHPSMLQRVFLCHLSHDNNTPQKALSCITDAVEAAFPGTVIIADDTTLYASDSDPRHLMLNALPRFEASPLYTFYL